MLEDLKEKAGELRSKEVELKERELAVQRRQVFARNKYQKITTFFKCLSTFVTVKCL
jgi:hypothetical protein